MDRVELFLNTSPYIFSRWLNNYLIFDYPVHFPTLQWNESGDLFFEINGRIIFDLLGELQVSVEPGTRPSPYLIIMQFQIVRLSQERIEVQFLSEGDPPNTPCSYILLTEI